MVEIKFCALLFHNSTKTVRVEQLSFIVPVITDIRMWIMGTCFYNLMTLYLLMRFLRVNLVSGVYNVSIVKEFVI